MEDWLKKIAYWSLWIAVLLIASAVGISWMFDVEFKPKGEVTPLAYARNTLVVLGAFGVMVASYCFEHSKPSAENEGTTEAEAD